MKTSIKVLAGVLALSAASLADAQIVLKVTGSTAFRASFMKGVENVMTNVYSGAYWTNDGSTSLEGANLCVIKGSISNTPVVIQCCWAGSVGGVNVIDSDQLPALPNSSGGNPAATHAWMKASLATFPVTTTGTVADSDYDADVTADVSMSDSFQKSTPYNARVLVDKVVGIVPFKWAANIASPAGLTNVTPKLAQSLLAGSMSLMLWTGNTADANKGVYPVGRSFDSGTRCITFAESGYGINKPPQQYKVNITAGAVSSILLYPAETVLGISYNDGESGYSSGSGVSAALKATSTGAFSGGDYGDGTGYFVGYLGRKDFQGATGARELTFAGFLDTDQNIQTGSYTFWSYEHLFYRNTLVDPQLSLANWIGRAIHDTTANLGASGQPYGILCSSMQVGRQADGGAVSKGARFTTY